MVKIHAVADVTLPFALQACRVCRVDSANAVCVAHDPQCPWATPYGNYCEHPLVAHIAEYDPLQDKAILRFYLH